MKQNKSGAAKEPRIKDSEQRKRAWGVSSQKISLFSYLEIGLDAI